MKDSKTSRHEDILKYLETFSDEEKVVLKAMGRLNVSVGKNIALHTIHKKIPDEYLHTANKTIKSLCKKGFIVKYRKENYGLSKKGRDVANHITKKDMRDKNADLRLLLLLNKL